MKDLYNDDVLIAIGCIGEIKAVSESLKNRLSTVWERSVNFANGNQLYNQDSGVTATNDGQFTRGAFDRRKQIYVTNEIEPIIRTLVSFMTRSKPAITAFTNSDSPQDYARANLAELLMKAKYDLDREFNLSREAAFWALTLGTVFRKDYWDSSAGSNYTLPEYDELGNEIIDPETGKVKTKYHNTGNNQAAIITPYSMDFDFSVTGFQEIPLISESYYIDIDWVLESFNKDLPGFKKDSLEKIPNDAPVPGTLNLLENLKFASPMYGRGGVPGGAGKNKTIVTETYIRPNDKWPKGRMIITAGGKVVYDSPKEKGSPYYLGYENMMWHPYTMFTYEPWIGRFLGKGIVEQLIPLQMRLNEINGAILENANTLAKTDVLSPEGAMKRNVINGRGANIYEFKAVPGLPPPVKWPGVPLPQQFFQERSNLIDAMVRIAGTNFVMQGQPPTGVTAASAIQQLLENANSQQSDLMISWEKFHEEGFTKKLRLIRKFNDVPDSEVIDYMRTIAKDASDRNIKDFIGEDIGDGISLRIESGSMIPKNESLLRENYFKFAQMGLLGDLADLSPQGAKLRQELLAKFGEKPLETTTNIELEKACWENERIELKKPIEVGEFDQDEVHLAEHLQYFQDPTFIEKSTPEQKQALYIHIKQHEQKLQMKQQQAMQQQMQQAMQVEQFKNQMKINEINAQNAGEEKGEATVEVIKGKNKAVEEKIKGDVQLNKQKMQNATQLAKEQMIQMGKSFNTSNDVIIE